MKFLRFALAHLRLPHFFLIATFLVPRYIYGAWSWKKVLPLSEEQVINETHPLGPRPIITIDAHAGSINIQPGQSNTLSITAIKKGIAEELPQTTIETSLHNGSALVKTVEKDTDSSVTVTYSLKVPPQTSKIIVSSNRGPITIQNVDCPLEVTTATGNLSIKNATQSVKALVGKGSITLDQKSLPSSASLFLEAMRGNIELSLPKRVNATLNARTLKGKLKCTIPVTLEPRTTVLTPESWERMQREARGSLGTSGVPITIDVTRGNIHIKSRS